MNKDIKKNEKQYDALSRIDKDGNIWTGTRARTPHFDWLNRSILGEHYILCGEDSILSKIEEDIYTFIECDPYLPSEDTTVIQFIDNEAWLYYDTVTFFSEELSESYIKRLMKDA